MHIALLVGRFGPGTGTGGVAWRLAETWAARGHRVEVWAGRLDRALAGVPVHALGPRESAASRVPPGFVRLALDRVPGCEVARASGGVHALWAAIRGRRLGDGREARLDAATVRSARIVVCNAFKTAADVMAWHQIPRDRIRIVRTTPDRPAPVDRRLIRARWHAEGRVALFLGHGFRRKNLPVAWSAFARAAGAADRLVVVGTDAHAARWLSPARAALGDRLVVEAADLGASLLPGADALLHPTLYDAASNAVLEALAAGVPPVVSLRDGAAECVSDRALIVADPYDVGGFAAALRYAWASADRGVAAPAHPLMADALEAILREARDG